MVTGEASYAQVVEAAESALDSYLLEPHASAALAQRLTQARHRKLALQNVSPAARSVRQPGRLAGSGCRGYSAEQITLT